MLTECFFKNKKAPPPPPPPSPLQVKWTVPYTISALPKGFKHKVSNCIHTPPISTATKYQIVYTPRPYRHKLYTHPAHIDSNTSRASVTFSDSCDGDREYILSKPDSMATTKHKSRPTPRIRFPGVANRLHFMFILRRLQCNYA